MESSAYLVAKVQVASEASCVLGGAAIEGAHGWEGAVHSPRVLDSEYIAKARVRGLSSLCWVRSGRYRLLGGVSLAALGAGRAVSVRHTARRHGSSILRPTTSSTFAAIIHGETMPSYRSIGQDVEPRVVCAGHRKGRYGPANAAATTPRCYLYGNNGILAKIGSASWVQGRGRQPRRFVLVRNNCRPS